MTTLLCLTALLLTAGQDPAPGERTIPGAPQARAEEQLLIAYAVGDLTGANELAQLPPLPESASGLSEARALLDRYEERLVHLTRVETAATDLADVIRSYMKPRFDKGRQELRVSGRDKLILFASAAQHEWVEGFLEQQRQRTEFIECSVLIVSVPQGSLAQAGFDRPSNTFSSNAEFRAALAKLERIRDFERLQSPLIATRPRQKGTVSIVEQIPYVKDYNVEIVQPGDVMVADPEIAIAHEGIVLETRAVPLDPGRFGIDVDVHHSRVERPIPTKEIQLTGASSPVTISQPQVTEVEMHSRVVLAPGASVLFVTPDPATDRDWVVTLTLVRTLAASPR
ncbi:MAG: hypothetical protein GY711_11710 [bacterium]|nr:hypothetical protein [bacterium]